MNTDQSFGDWLRQRRRVLDLTQEELAGQVGCSAITLRKLEAEERRPSKQIAERLADILKVTPEDRAAFLRFARGDPFAAPSDARNLDKSERPKHNLPLELTSFIGRAADIVAVKQLLSQARLVTLTGPGGAGKTRLALQVAAGQIDTPAFPDGVWLVELAPLADPALVPQAAANVLGLREAPGRALSDTVLDHLRPRRMLLVLDNCEHLIAACAELAELLLRACPQLTILATSRERLNLAGEVAYPVPALSLPGPDQTRSLEILAQFEAVRLFTERARAALPAFTLTTDNAVAITKVCQQLDGMPLAVELAAARVPVLRVEQIAARLAERDRFHLLSAGSRTAAPRHRTLQAVMDWSYDLLSATEKLLLQRLAVFMGGWTLEMAEVVGAGDSLPAVNVLELLAQLVNKSLVVARHETGAEVRYHLLETVRQYALAKLTDSGEADDVWRRAATYIIELEKTFRPFEHLPTEIDRLEMEIDNLRAIMTWSQSPAGSTELGLHLAIIMFGLCASHGYLSEGRAWLEAALARAEADGEAYPWLRARALGALGQMLAYQGEFLAGEALLARSMKLHQELGEVQVSAAVLGRMGVFARERGDTATARLRLEESLRIFRELGDQAGIADASLSLSDVASMEGNTELATSLLQEVLVFARAHNYSQDMAWALNHLGRVAQIKGDYERARQLHEESLPWFEELGDNAETYQGLGEAALGQRNAALATTHFTRALKLSLEQGARPYFPWCLAGLAGAAALDEEPERAARLWAAGEALRQSIGVREAPASHATHARLMAAARQQLGDAVFDEAWAAGQAMTPEQAIELALEGAG